jgi:hypothetical protein
MRMHETAAMFLFGLVFIRVVYGLVDLEEAVVFSVQVEKTLFLISVSIHFS